MSKILAIDLGTTNSAMAIYEGDDFKIIPNKEGKNTTPSIVAFTDKGDVLIGDSAKRQAITNPEKTIYSIKRIMGMMFNDSRVKEAESKTQYKIVEQNKLACVEINGKIYTPQEISSKILTKLKNDAEEFLGEKIQDAIITVPAYFGDSARQATKDAGIIAGLNVIRIINEPTAAALAYGLDKKHEEKIVIFDCGGGTHDVSILEIGDGTFEVLATDGNAFLGGDDFTNKIVDYLLEETKKSIGVDLKNDKMAMQRIVDAADNAKKELSSTNETSINLPFITMNESGPQHLTLNLTKAKFESLIENLVDETLKHVKVCLKNASLDINDINEVIMVGGSTRIPLIKTKVSEFFNGKKLNNSVNPDEVVSAGAAVQGGVLKGDIKDILLLDVTPLSLGIEVMGGMVEFLIEKGSTIPINKSKVFSNAEDNQPQATIHVVQGEDKLAINNKSLGQFNIELSKAMRGQSQIEVKFDIDANGILKVSAIDKATGKSSDIVISGSSGLSNEEIEKMVKDAEINNIKNKEKIEAISKRNELDGLIFNIKKQSKEMGTDSAIVPGLDVLLTKAENLVKEQSENKSLIEDTINELNQLVQQMSNQQSNESKTNEKKKDEDVIDAEVE